MDFSTLFRTKENLNLDKNTLTVLRYIAIFGQFIAINIVFFYLDLQFPLKESYIIILIGLITNLYLQSNHKFVFTIQGKSKSVKRHIRIFISSV